VLISAVSSGDNRIASKSAKKFVVLVSSSTVESFGLISVIYFSSWLLNFDVAPGLGGYVVEQGIPHAGDVGVFCDDLRYLGRHGAATRQSPDGAVTTEV
jgi:hypothetical protein